MKSSKNKLRLFCRSRAAEAIAELEIQNLIKGELLVKSYSPWVSPILIVKKKDSTNQVFIDYRRLNAITKKDSYPLPRNDNAIDKLGGAQFFSAMDLISRYRQINLLEEDQEKHAIIAQSGLYQPTQMPQGLSNIPTTFQRVTDSEMGDLKLLCVLVYLDHINVFSNIFSDYLDHLNKCLSN